MIADLTFARGVGGGRARRGGEMPLSMSLVNKSFVLLFQFQCSNACGVISASVSKNVF